MIRFLGGANYGSQDLGLDVIIWAVVGVTLAYAALYVLRSIGLYKLAKAQNFKFKIMAVLPLVWVYVAFRLVGESKYFGKPIAKLAIIFTIILSLAVLINIAYQAIIYYPIVGNLLFNGETKIYIIADQQGFDPTTMGLKAYAFIDGLFVDKNFIDPYFNISVVVNWLRALSYTGMIFDLASIFIKITLFINIFKKYWPQKTMMASFLSIFFETLLFPIFIFVIRNNKPINYEEYIRKKYQYTRNPYGAYGQGGPYGNPYANHGGEPYGANPYGEGDSGINNDNPFNEFDQNEKTEPFEEFNDKSDKND